MSIENLFVTIYDYMVQLSKKYDEQSMDNEDLTKFSRNHYYYILAINELRKPTCSDLSNELKVTKPAVTAMVNKLIKQGYVYKSQSEQDKRFFYLSLTSKGKKIVKTPLYACEHFTREIESYLPKEELKSLENTLQKIVANCKQK